MQLTLRDVIQNGLLDELAICLGKGAIADMVLIAIGFPIHRIGENPQNHLDYWLEIGKLIQSGVIEGGFETLLHQAAQRFPSNPKFLPFKNISNPISDHDSLRLNRQQYLQELSNGFDIFLSCSSADVEVAKQFALKLQECGANPWLYIWHSPLGKTFVEELEDILGSVSYMAAFIGRNGLGPWQAKEIQYFFDKTVFENAKLVPVLLPGIEMRDLPPFLSTYNGIKLEDDEAIRRLCGEIRKL